MDHIPARQRDIRRCHEIRLALPASTCSVTDQKSNVTGAKNLGSSMVGPLLHLVTPKRTKEQQEFGRLRCQTSGSVHVVLCARVSAQNAQYIRNFTRR